jgi:DNA polymerase-3 subunit alpha
MIDFLKRIDMSSLNIQSLEALIKAGAFDSISENRAGLLINYEEIYNKYNSFHKNRAQGQQSFAELFSDDNSFMEEDLKYNEIDELETETILNQEKEFLGVYLSAHPLDKYNNKLKKLNTLPINTASAAAEGSILFTAGHIISYKEHITKRNNKMAFITINDQNDKIEVIIFADLFKTIDFDLAQEKNIAVLGRKNDSQLIAEYIYSLENNFLIINIDELQNDKIIGLKKYLLKKEGNIPVLLKKDSKMIAAEKDFFINNNKRTLQELRKALGESNFRFI